MKSGKIGTVREHQRKGGVFKIFSRAIDRKTRKLVGYRTEFIDTAKNELFEGATNPKEVEGRFEAFWGLDPYDDIVEVDKVESKPKTKSKGDNWGIKMLR